MTTVDLTPNQLRQAADIKERIESLQGQLDAILGAATAAPGPAAPVRTGRRNMSAAGRARIAAAARARWAAYRKVKPAAAPKVRRKFSAAGRAALAAAARARWAAARKAGKSRL